MKQRSNLSNRSASEKYACNQFQFNSIQFIQFQFQTNLMFFNVKEEEGEDEGIHKGRAEDHTRD